MFKISAWFAPLARRLHAWVKATVFAEAVSASTPARLVCYVLQDRHLSNLLRAIRGEQARRPAAGRAAARRRWVWARCSCLLLNRRRRKPGTEVSPLLAGMVPAKSRDPLADADRAGADSLGACADKQESILAALLAETWRASGALRQFFAVLLHGRHTLVRFSAPLSPARTGAWRRCAPLPEDCAAQGLARPGKTSAASARWRSAPDLPTATRRSRRSSVAIPCAPRIAADATPPEHPARCGTGAPASSCSRSPPTTTTVPCALELFLSWLWEQFLRWHRDFNFDALTPDRTGAGHRLCARHRSHIDYLLLPPDPLERQ